MGFFDSIGSSLGSIGSSIFGGLFNSGEASKNREFQQKAMQNQMQWRVKDLRKAGINPMLAAMTPSGAPSGSTAHAEFGNPMHDAASVRKMAAETQVDKQMVNESKSREELQAQQLQESKAREALYNEEKRLTSAQATSAYSQALMDSAKVEPYQTETGGLTRSWIENLPEIVRGPMRIVTDVVDKVSGASPDEIKEKSPSKSTKENEDSALTEKEKENLRNAERLRSAATRKVLKEASDAINASKKKQ